MTDFQSNASDTRPEQEKYPTVSKSTVRVLVFILPIVFISANILFYFFIMRYDAQSRTQEFTIIDLLEEPVDVLIMGDSVTNSGINPHVIEELTGLRAINLSNNARWTFYHEVWVTEYYIEKFGPPRYIIWGHVPDQVHRVFDPVEMLSSSSYPLGLTWQSDRLQPIVTDMDKITIIFRRLLPLYFRDRTIRQIIQDLASGQPILTDLSQIVENRAYSARDTIDVEFVERQASAVPIFDRELSDDNKRVGDIFLNMIEEYDIQVYTFITPAHFIYGEKEEFQDSLKPLREYWHEQDEAYTMLEFNPEVLILESEHFIDADHLNIYGADIFTRYLVDWIWGDYVPPPVEKFFSDSD